MAQVSKLRIPPMFSLDKVEFYTGPKSPPKPKAPSRKRELTPTMKRMKGIGLIYSDDESNGEDAMRALQEQQALSHEAARAAAGTQKTENSANPASGSDEGSKGQPILIDGGDADTDWDSNDDLPSVRQLLENKAGHTGSSNVAPTTPKDHVSEGRELEGVGELDTQTVGGAVVHETPTQLVGLPVTEKENLLLQVISQRTSSSKSRAGSTDNEQLDMSNEREIPDSEQDLRNGEKPDEASDEGPSGDFESPARKSGKNGPHHVKEMSGEPQIEARCVIASSLDQPSSLRKRKRKPKHLKTTLSSHTIKRPGKRQRLEEDDDDDTSSESQSSDTESETAKRQPVVQAKRRKSKLKPNTHRQSVQDHRDTVGTKDFNQNSKAVKSRAKASSPQAALLSHAIDSSSDEEDHEREPSDEAVQGAANVTISPIPGSDMKLVLALFHGPQALQSALAFQNSVWHGRKLHSASVQSLRSNMLLLTGFCKDDDSWAHRTIEFSRRENERAQPDNSISRKRIIRADNAPARDMSKSGGDTGSESSGVIKMRRGRWKRSDEQRLRAYVGEERQWPWIAKALRRTVPCVQKHWEKMQDQ